MAEREQSKKQRVFHKGARSQYATTVLSELVLSAVSHRSEQASAESARPPNPIPEVLLLTSICKLVVKNVCRLF